MFMIILETIPSSVHHLSESSVVKTVPFDVT